LFREDKISLERAAELRQTPLEAFMDFVEVAIAGLGLAGSGQAARRRTNAYRRTEGAEVLK
jgi:hypothetical protein